MSHAQQHVLASAIVLALIVVFGIHVFLFPMYTSNPATRRTKISVYEQALCHSNLRPSKISLQNKTPCPKYGIVSAVQGGRLGNQIWEYASVWATARRTGLEPYVPRCILKTLEEHFEKLSIPPLSNIGYCTLGVDQIVSLSEWNSTHQNIIIPRHAAYWSQILIWLDDLRQEFKFKFKYRLYAQMVLMKAASRFELTNATYISVHVRRTDYVEYLWQKFNVRPAPVRYYLNAMDYFLNKFKNAIFLVASDNIAWCKYNLKSDHRITFISDSNGKGPGKDLAVLSACNHSIIDYGTYGSFAAILAAGETVVFNVSSHFTTLIAEALSNWIIMS
ncbi:galactoside alpha-(1,2)-fucosyltransferase 2-like [Leptopilina heterotoma]|uniref:galactoside alpha-(1,2)-fucosyltransferase 2-like n=1 Tax=Leptopilina heterotoma TaxID=63436 RepID=UPI001CAA019A|nr:galactoside alpha-(1,2)-fucosyltransferase 2-like [Leptopilina heterotoma]